MNVVIPLTESLLISLGLIVATADSSFYKTFFDSGTTTLIISNKEKEDMKIVRSLKESCVLIKSVIETIENKSKEQKRWFLSMLAGKGVISAGDGVIWVNEATVRAGQDF